jgi:hypothetical protein
MTITYTLPSITQPHGGYRIIFAHIEGLQAKGHDVRLYVSEGDATCDWYDITFPVTKDIGAINTGLVVHGSPHSMNDYPYCFQFVQMAEHLFRVNDPQWTKASYAWYHTNHPKLYGSNWVGEFLHGEKHYIQDGINLSHFPIERPSKPGNILLVEGWERGNNAKDVQAIAPKVAMRMKQWGWRVFAYGFRPLTRYTDIPDVYIQSPTLEQLNELYRQASILVKATRYDSRALSPIEAATKGCVTVRGIIHGDDYLVNGVNCYRVGYDYDEVLAATLRAANADPAIREAAYEMVQAMAWNPIIDQIEKIYANYWSREIAA